MNGYLSIPNILPSHKVDYEIAPSITNSNSVLRVFIDDTIKGILNDLKNGDPASLCCGLGGVNKYSLEFIGCYSNSYMRFLIL